MKYGPELKVISTGDCNFTLQLSEKDTHVFVTPTALQKDIIILTIKLFNEQNCK